MAELSTLGAVIKAAYEAEANTNAFTDTHKAIVESAVRTTDDDVSEALWVLDEDDFASDSDTQVPTQQSTKAYVDAAVLAIDLTQAAWVLDEDDFISDSAIHVPTQQSTKAYVDTGMTTLDISTVDWVLDEDDMLSDSAAHLATQQSVKAYVDANAPLLVDPAPTLGAPLQLGGFSITGSAGTVAVNTPILAATQEWNDGAVAFTAMSINAIDTASDAGSLLLSLQLNGVNTFTVDKGGVINTPNRAAAIPYVSSGTDVAYENAINAIINALVAHGLAAA